MHSAWAPFLDGASQSGEGGYPRDLKNPIVLDVGNCSKCLDLLYAYSVADFIESYNNVDLANLHDSPHTCRGMLDSI